MSWSAAVVAGILGGLFGAGLLSLLMIVSGVLGLYAVYELARLMDY